MTKTLIYDIETAPIIGTVWGKYEQNLIWSIQDWYMLCFAYKWLGEKKTYVIAQNDFKGYKPPTDDDLNVVSALHHLFDEADIIVAHNGNSFDQKKTQARFIYHKLGPPSPYQQVDTKLVARRYFNFTSNKLDDLGEFFGVGKKLKTDADLWKNCMAGDEKAWKKMKKYNIQDVILLEKVYLAMRPWDTQHPNLANLAGRPEICPRCGKNKGFWAQGKRYTKTGSYQRYQCLACGSYVSKRSMIKGDKPEYV